MGGRGTFYKDGIPINILNKLFNFTKEETTLKKEFIAGLTAFFAVVYIIAVNSSILSEAGVPREAAVLATILASSLGSILVGLYSNAPLIMIPGMGVNALFSYTVVGSMGLSWNSALGTVIMGGIIFSIVAFTPLWRLLMEAIPPSLNRALTTGIGLFLTILGLQKSGIVVSGNGSFGILGDLSSLEVQAAILILIIALVLFIKNVPGNFLITIIAGTVISLILGINNFDFNKDFSFSLGGYKELFFNFSFEDILTPPFWVASISFALVLIFSNLGVINAYVGEMLKVPGKFPRSFKANAISALTCGFLGTSPTVTAAETAAGIAVGGKTGFTSIVTAALFLISIPLTPFISIIPDIAVAPIFIIIGFLMLQTIVNIDFTNINEGIPAFLTIVLIPFTSDIVNGMSFGFIAYPLLKLISGRGKEVKPTLYVIALLFVLNFVFSSVF